MDRKTFILGLMAGVATIGNSMNLKDLNRLAGSLGPTGRMPVLFLGHGSPMNAIEENEFVQGFRKVVGTLERPRAVLCISAHWETRGTMVTAMQMPRTIHDFGGFPKALFEVQYPAPGSPELAQEAKDLVKGSEILLDDHWGLDHGAWSVIKHMYPDADVPVIQLSLDLNKSPREHYELAQEISSLRDKGVLIVGSGNMIHNLRMADWNKLGQEYAYDWAIEAREKMNGLILKGDHQALIDYSKAGREFQLSIPTPEHYLPLLYTLALQTKQDSISLFNDKAIGGSLSMTSVKIG